MKNKPRIYYLQWEPALYLKRTIWMAPLEDLLYRRLIDAWWMNKGLPSNEQKLAGYARYPQEDFDRFWPNVRDFFYVKGENGEFLGHEKLEELYENCLTESKTKSDSGKLGAAKRWQRHGTAIADHMANDSYTDTDTYTDNNPPIVPPGGKSTSVDRFDEFWDIQIRKSGKKKCMQTWKSRKLDKIADKIIVAYMNQRREIFQHRDKDKIPLPLTWLNGDRWEDEIVSEKPKPKPTASYGNGFDQPPPRAQPPEASSLKNEHLKKWTQAERNNAKKLIRQAKDKAGIPSEPDEKQTTEQPATMAELLSAAKSCFAAWDEMGEPCLTKWEQAENAKKNKCHWCQLFERQRNGPAKTDNTKTLGDLI